MISVSVGFLDKNLNFLPVLAKDFATEAADLRYILGNKRSINDFYILHFIKENGRPPLKSVSTEDNIHLLRKRRQQQLSSNSTDNSLHPNSGQTPRASDSQDDDIRSASTTNLDRLRQEREENSLEMDCTQSRLSHRANMLVDVLPSFEMYNALHRHIPQGNVDPDRHDFPLLIKKFALKE